MADSAHPESTLARTTSPTRSRQRAAHLARRAMRRDPGTKLARSRHARDSQAWARLLPPSRPPATRPAAHPATRTALPIRRDQVLHRRPSNSHIQPDQARPQLSPRGKAHKAIRVSDPTHDLKSRGDPIPRVRERQAGVLHLDDHNPGSRRHPRVQQRARLPHALQHQRAGHQRGIIDKIGGPTPTRTSPPHHATRVRRRRRHRPQPHRHLRRTRHTHPATPHSTTRNRRSGSGARHQPVCPR